MHRSFNDFILDLYDFDPKAAKWLATEVLEAEEGENPLLRYTKIISKWEKYYDINNLLRWDATPQGFAYWALAHKAVQKGARRV